MSVPKTLLNVLILAAVLGGSSVRALADSISIQPTADTTLISVAPDNNLGGADFFNAGTTGSANPNRALLFYDLSTALPPGAIITSVELSMSVVRQPNSSSQQSFYSLRRMLQSWGEGTQGFEEGSPGLGLPSAPGEATWNDRFAGSLAWSMPGGQEGVDFSSALSATAPSGALGEDIFFESTGQLMADVQAWANSPESNFGWMLKSESEDVRKTARGIASRESGFGPLLTVNFVTVPEPSVLSLVSLFLLGAGWRIRKSRSTRRHLLGRSSSSDS